MDTRHTVVPVDDANCAGPNSPRVGEWPGLGSSQRQGEAIRVGGSVPWRGHDDINPTDHVHPNPGTRGVCAQSGAVAVEAGMLLPLLLTVLLAIVEVGAFIHAHVGTAAGARAAVRAGTSTAASDDPLAVARVALHSGLGVGSADIVELWVYRTDLSSYSVPTDCVTACVRIGINNLGDAVWLGGHWPPLSESLCANTNEHLGVRVVTSHTGITTRTFLPDRTSTHAVMRYEPRTLRDC